MSDLSGYYSIILGVAGAAVGAVFYQPQLGFAIGSALGAAIDIATAPKPEDQIFEQESIADIRITSASLGRMIPIIYGRFRIAGNIIWATTKQEHEHREESGGGGGGKGGSTQGPRQVTITKTYTVTLAVGLCEGPIMRISRMWADATLLYDETQDANKITRVEETFDYKIEESTGDEPTQTFVLYRGTETQEPSSIIEAFEGTGFVPAYRGLAYIILKDFDLGATGRVPNFTFEILRTEQKIGVPQDVVVLPPIGNSTQPTNIAAIYQAGPHENTHNSRILTLSHDDLTVLSRETILQGPVAVATGYAEAQPLLAITLGFNQCIDFVLGSVTLTQTWRVFVRTGAEATAGAQLGLTSICSDGASRFWYVLTTVNAVGQVDYLDTAPDTRFTVASAGVNQLVWRPGGAFGHVYVTCTTAGVVAKLLPSNTTMSLVENITVGSQPTAIITSGTDVIWVTNKGSNTVHKFTTDADKVSIAVGAAPDYLAEATDSYIWVSNTNALTVTRINATTNATQTFPLPSSPGPLAKGLSGKMWVLAPAHNRCYLVDTTGGVVTVLLPRLPTKIASDVEGNAWVVSEGAGVIVKILADASDTIQQGNQDGLANIVTDLNLRAGIKPGEIDVSGLDNTPVDMVINGIGAARLSLTKLMQAFFLTGIESGPKLKYRSHGEASILTIPEEALAAGQDTATESSLTIVRAQELEMPTQVIVTYPSPQRNYEQGTQIQQIVHHQTGADNPVVLDLPIAMEEQQAKNLAEVSLYEAWVNRTTYNFTLPRKFLALEPFDAVTIPWQGISHQIRLVELTIGANFILECKGVAHRSYIYNDFESLPGEGVGDTTELPALAAATAILVDAPPLHANDLALRYFAALTPAVSGALYEPSTLYESRDGGATYVPVVTSSLAAYVGDITGTLGAPVSPHTWDIVNTLTVVMRAGTLTSVTDVAVLNGANLAAIGPNAAGEYELIQFVTATLTGTRTYQLSRLLRGRQGTEVYVGAHIVGEKFILFDSYLQNALDVEYPLERIGVASLFKVTDAVTTLAQATAFSFTPQGRSLTAWAPVVPPALSIHHSPAEGDWTIGWLQRSRLFGAWLDNVGISNDPDHTGFKVKIYSDNTYATVLRTITTDGGNPANAEATKTTVYTAAEQVVDFTVEQQVLFIGVLQTTLGKGDGYETQTVLGTTFVIPYLEQFESPTVTYTLQTAEEWES